MGTQNFNRYSYCLNNPLKYTDPTGYMIRPHPIASFMGEIELSEADWNEELNGVDDVVAFSDGLMGGGGSTGTGGVDGGGGGGSYFFAGGIEGNDPLRGIGTFAYGMATVEAEMAQDHTNTVAAAQTAAQTASNDAAVAAVLGAQYGIPKDNQLSEQTVIGYNGLINPYSSLSASYAIAAEIEYGNGNVWGTAQNVNNAIGLGLGSMEFGMNTTLAAATGKGIEATKGLEAVAKTFKYSGTIGFVTSIGIHASMYNQTKEWGYLGQMGMDGLEYGLMSTSNPYAMGAGYGLTILDISGGMNWFYNGLNNEQQYYNITGGIYIPPFIP